MKNLLLIANISASNDQLIEYAAHFCKHYQLKLHILHVSSSTPPVLISSSYAFMNKNFKDIELEQGKKFTQRMSKVVAPILDNEYVQVSIHQGNEKVILESFITDNFIDLIMVGTADLEKKTEYTDHKQLLMNVISTPLFVVPENHLFVALNELDFLTTHTENDKHNLLKVIGMFPDSGLTLTHLEMKEDNELVKSKSRKWIEYVKAKAGKSITYECIKGDVRKFIESENFSLIKRFDAFVFTTQKRNFWSRLMDPSTTLGFLFGLELPSIIFKIGD